MAKNCDVLLILGDQLFDPALILEAFPGKPTVFMAEDRGLCTHFKYHRQKLAFFLSAMRHYRDELELAGWKVRYTELNLKPSAPEFLDRLEAFLKESQASCLHSFDVSDRFFEVALERRLAALGVEWKRVESPGFLTPRSEFEAYLGSVKKPFMKTFYERQRRRLGVLVDSKGRPEGGEWSFDVENRKKLPEKIALPGVPDFSTTLQDDPHFRAVAQVVDAGFSQHPGSTLEAWLPVTRKQARSWLKDFISKRLVEFGPYEDALTRRDDHVFHSVLTPFLNCGLLTPREVLDAVLAAHAKRDLPLPSVEGFVRQVIGWREFIFGVDRHFGVKQWTTNHWKHERRLGPAWYSGETGLPLLDYVIKKALRTGYAHHIERLMVVGNVMLLSEIHPHEAHRWFMELFIDSADWVMGPNVFGMGICSDGGVFATKPYICGSNYWLKMSDESKGDWCDELDGLYWRFIHRHQKELLKNPRMGTMARALDRISSERRERLFRAAEGFIQRTTH